MSVSARRGIAPSMTTARSRRYGATPRKSWSSVYAAPLSSNCWSAAKYRPEIAIYPSPSGCPTRRDFLLGELQRWMGPPIAPLIMAENPLVSLMEALDERAPHDPCPAWNYTDLQVVAHRSSVPYAAEQPRSGRCGAPRRPRGVRRAWASGALLGSP